MDRHTAPLEDREKLRSPFPSSSPTPASRADDGGEAAAQQPCVATCRTARPVSEASFMHVWRSLSWLDRLLSPLILLFMILGVVIGEFAPNVNENLSRGELNGTPAPLAVGLIVMMWPILTKVQFEKLPALFRTRQLWLHVGLSLIINWILAPLLMLGLAWATLPDLEDYRTGIILVGLARCIAMVMVWNQLARGDAEVCAVLVILNSALQMVLYAPLAVLFVNVISRSQTFGLKYRETAIAVALYLGIPLAAGVATRFSMLLLLGRRRFERHFLPYFAPLSLAALLYTILIIFALQARNLLENIGAAFRTIVPLVVYFALVWTLTLLLLRALSRRYGRATWGGYKLAVVQAFTAGSNNFELAIGVCVAVYGGGSAQALAATVGPLVEVPTLLALTWVALYLGEAWRWEAEWEVGGDEATTVGEVGGEEEKGDVDGEAERTGERGGEQRR